MTIYYFLIIFITIFTSPPPPVRSLFFTFNIQVVILDGGTVLEKPSPNAMAWKVKMWQKKNKGGGGKIGKFMNKKAQN